MTISDYESEALEDLKFDINNFDNHVVNIGLKRIKWGKYLFEEERITSVCEEKLKELYKKRFKYYLYDDPQKIEKKNIDIWVQGDDEYREAEKIYKEQKSKEKFVNQIISALEQQSFSANTILKHIMFQAGA